MDRIQTQTAAEVFGVRLRELRTAHRWSQADVADLLAGFGVQMLQSTVAKIERGKRPTNVNELLALARVFGTSITRLVEPVDVAFGITPLSVEAEEALAASRAALEEAKAEVDMERAKGVAEWAALGRRLDDLEARQRAHEEAVLAITDTAKVVKSEAPDA